jgi:hypothetical protein
MPTEEDRENEAKLVALKAAIQAGIDSGWEDADVADAELDQYMDDLVAEAEGGQGPPAGH